MEFDRVPDIAKYLSAIFLLAYLGGHLTWKFLPLYFELYIDSVFLIGVLTALPAAAPILLDIPVGNLVQRAGERVVILLGLVANVLPGLLYLLPVPAALAAGKVMEGVAKSLSWTGSWSLALQTAEDDIESLTIGVFLMGTNLAAIIGPILGGYLIASQGWAVPLWLWAGTGMLGVALYIAYIGTGRTDLLGSAARATLHRRTYRDDRQHIRNNWTAMRLPLMLIFCYSIIKSFFWLAVPLLLDALGADIPTMGIIFGIAAVPYAFQFVFGDVADRYGMLPTATALSIASIPPLLLMAVLDAPLVVGGLFLVASLLMAGLSPPLHTLFDRRVPDDLEGELTGILEMCKHTGQTVGPLMAGTVASLWSLNAAFIAAAGVATALAGTSMVGMRTGRTH